MTPSNPRFASVLLPACSSGNSAVRFHWSVATSSVPDWVGSNRRIEFSGIVFAALLRSVVT